MDKTVLDSLVCAFVSVVFNFPAWESTREGLVVLETSDYCHLILLNASIEKINLLVQLYSQTADAVESRLFQDFLGFELLPRG